MYIALIPLPSTNHLAHFRSFQSSKLFYSLIGSETNTKIGFVSMDFATLVLSSDFPQLHQFWRLDPLVTHAKLAWQVVWSQEVQT
jgi:hypothetical protein